MSNKKLIEKLYNKPLEEILREMYVINGLSLRTIADELCVCHNTVKNWIDEYHLHYKKPAWNKGLSKKEMEQIINLKK